MVQKHNSFKLLNNLMLILIIFSMIGTILSCSDQVSKEQSDDVEENINPYDSALAKRVGADDYGMKSYVIAYLKAGPNRDLPKEEAAALQTQHMENIGKLAKEGKLVLAGPFLEADYEVRGIYIFDTESVEEAAQWTATDPAIQAGSLVMELHPWYGSAALMLINDLHDKVQKVSI